MESELKKKKLNLQKMQRKLEEMDYRRGDLEVKNGQLAAELFNLKQEKYEIENKIINQDIDKEEEKAILLKNEYNKSRVRELSSMISVFDKDSKKSHKLIFELQEKINKLKFEVKKSEEFSRESINFEIEDNILSQRIKKFVGILEKSVESLSRNLEGMKNRIQLEDKQKGILNAKKDEMFRKINELEEESERTKKMIKEIENEFKLVQREYEKKGFERENEVQNVSGRMKERKKYLEFLKEGLKNLKIILQNFQEKFEKKIDETMVKMKSQVEKLLNRAKDKHNVKFQDSEEFWADILEFVEKAYEGQELMN